MAEGSLKTGTDRVPEKFYKINEIRYVIPLAEPTVIALKVIFETRMHCKATRMEENRSRNTYIKE